VTHIFIFAGSQEQATFLAKETEIPRTGWTYLHRPDQLLGLRNGYYILYGTWYENSDAKEIGEMILRAGMMECRRKTTPKKQLTFTTEE
jgi:hypothetical protein